jgi:hypothetical protein
MLLVSFLMVKNLLILLFDYQNYKDNMELIISIIMLLATVGAIFLAWRNLKKIQEQIESQEAAHKESMQKIQEQIKLQEEESEKNDIARAWEIVGRKASGNSGKIEALEFLNKKGYSLMGIDLSAKTHGGFVWLGFVDLRGADLFEADLSGTCLVGAVLSGACLVGAVLSGASLSGAFLDAVDFSQSTIDETTHFGPVSLKDKNKLPMFSQEQIDELGITMKVIGKSSEGEYHKLKITLNPPKPSKPA